jgi:hypothetical protein
MSVNEAETSTPLQGRNMLNRWKKRPQHFASSISGEKEEGGIFIAFLLSEVAP